MVLALLFRKCVNMLVLWENNIPICDISDVIALMVFGELFEKMSLEKTRCLWSCHQWQIDFAPWIMNHPTPLAGFRYDIWWPWCTCLGRWIPLECPSCMHLYCNDVITLLPSLMMRLLWFLWLVAALVVCSSCLSIKCKSVQLHVLLSLTPGVFVIYHACYFYTGCPSFWLRGDGEEKVEGRKGPACCLHKRFAWWNWCELCLVIGSRLHACDMSGWRLRRAFSSKKGWICCLFFCEALVWWDTCHICGAFCFDLGEGKILGSKAERKICTWA